MPHARVRTSLESRHYGEIGDEFEQTSNELWHGEILEDYQHKPNKTE